MKISTALLNFSQRAIFFFLLFLIKNYNYDKAMIEQSNDRTKLAYDRTSSGFPHNLLLGLSLCPRFFRESEVRLIQKEHNLTPRSCNRQNTVRETCTRLRFYFFVFVLFLFFCLFVCFLQNILRFCGFDVLRIREATILLLQSGFQITVDKSKAIGQFRYFKIHL